MMYLPKAPRLEPGIIMSDVIQDFVPQHNTSFLRESACTLCLGV